MKDSKGRAHTLLLMVTAAIFVVFLVLLMARSDQRNKNRTQISLPGGGTVQPGVTPGTDENSGSITITPENVALVVQSLARPENYRQTLDRTLRADGIADTAVVQIWTRGQVQKVIVSQSHQVRHILTDGKDAYLWYEDDPGQVQRVTLPEGVTVEELCSVPSYETVIALPSASIQQCAYLRPELFDNAPCLYLSVQEGEAVIRDYWVNMSTGLLCMAEAKEEGESFFSLTQISMEELESDDRELTLQLCLPDGTAPFSTGAR